MHTFSVVRTAHPFTHLRARAAGSREHLHRYATEFEFRWNNRTVKDGERMEVLVEQTQGKRFTYKRCV